MIIQYSGLISYQKGLDLQQQSFDLVKANGRPVAIGCEHYPVITLGRSAQAQNEFLYSQQELRKKGIEIFETDRGGQATLHSPGQLVIYPIVPLRDYGISVRDFVRTLEITTVEWLKLHKIKAFSSDEAGVYTERGKIGFVGIRVQNGISRHGLAINLHNDLSLFQSIRSCGVSARSLDSLERAGVLVEMQEAFDQWINVFISQLIALREHSMQRGNSGFSH
jgi:lipoate-protein ligase B